MTAQEAATLQVVEQPGRAAAMLHPLRMKLLAALREPDSAAGLAGRLGLPRQKVNYHLRELERHALVELVEERRKGNCVERLMQATARSFVISPATLAALAADPQQMQDRFSSAYLTALVAQALRDLGVLRAGADQAGKRLPTFSLQAEIRFASAASRAAFTGELAGELARLTARYHDENAAGGRRFRFLLGAYPAVDGSKGEPSAPVATANSKTRRSQ